MKKSKLILRKVLILLICSIIPLVSAWFIGKYTYNRYHSEYFKNYMKAGAEDSSEKIEKYLKYYTYSYDENVYHEELVTKDEELVLRFRIYRFVSEHTRYNNLSKPYLAYDLHYAFVVYDINYQKLIEIRHPDGDHHLNRDNLPTIYINIQDDYYDGNSINLTMDVPVDPENENSVLLIQDYNSSPEVDYNKKALNSRYVKWVDEVIDADFTDEVTIEVFMTDSLNEVDQTYKSTILTINKKDFYQTVSQLDISNYVQGANKDFAAAGYFAYILKTKIWWIALITVALMSFVTFSFYIVWNAEETNVKNKKEGKK